MCPVSHATEAQVVANASLKNIYNGGHGVTCGVFLAGEHMTDTDTRGDFSNKRY